MFGTNPCIAAMLQLIAANFVPTLAADAAEATVVTGSLSPELLLDFEVTPAVRPVLVEVQAGFALAKRDPVAAQQHLERLSEHKLAAVPTSLRRQVRSFICFSDSQRDTERLLLLADRWLAGITLPDDSEEQASYLVCKAGLHFAGSRHNDAFALMAQADALLTKYPRSVVKAELLLGRGYMDGYLGEVETATALLLQARDIFVGLRLASGVGTADLFLAHTYSFSNNATLAREIYQRLLDVALADGDQTSLPLLYHSIAGTFHPTQEYDQAMHWLNIGLTAAEQIGERTGRAHMHLAISRTHARSGNWTLAVSHATAVQSLADEMGNKNLFTRASHVLIDAAFNAKQFDRTVSMADAAVAEFERLGDLNGMMEANAFRIKALRELRQFEAALNAAQQQQTWAIQFAEKSSIETTERMRARYELDRKEQENTVLRLEKVRTDRALEAAHAVRNWQYVTTLLAALLAVVIGIWGFGQLRQRQLMQALALTDELTQLANRRNILSFVSVALQQARSLQQDLSVIAFDVDAFKAINDRYGHGGGDQVLRRLATSLGHVGRNQDRIGRIGGEEFLMVLPGAGATTALAAAERMRSAVEAMQFDDLATELRVTISLGVTVAAPGDKDSNELVVRADVALYRAKRNGRNRVESEFA